MQVLTINRDEAGKRHCPADSPFCQTIPEFDDLVVIAMGTSMSDRLDIMEGVH